MVGFVNDRLPLWIRQARGLLGRVAVCVLGAGFLWWVAVHVGPQTGTAIVHVTEANVVVTVGERTFPIGEADPVPLVCTLPAGTHRLTMKRGSVLLYTEVFTIRGGEEWILTAWDPARRPRDDAPEISRTRPDLAASGQTSRKQSRPPGPHPAAPAPVRHRTSRPGF